MAVTTETTRTATYERLIAVLVAVVALAAIVVTAVPSVRLVLGPADSGICPAVWPPVTSCAPGAHLVVVGVAVVVLTAAWLAVDIVLRRAPALHVRAGVALGLVVVALLTWSAANVPQPYFAAWSRLFS